ncbi:amino acid transporter [Jannaschia pagri]|uniref:Amino acid transporter n=1 Tax=Jannaschia pagri TaxID=2829797 RepID=A0ABQ4NGY9_9RHOB|nr:MULTISPECIES: LysE family transporter [unclassified Jannaschia]GIT90214.1 amino acid transporter [Jannaschia sp. AI_61]GIT93680.1 amino acid transporter [Jannaschia sp. AI_62]
METLLIGLATFAVVCASPGPAVVAVVTTAMARGFGATVALTLGMALALGGWGILAAAGFGAVLAAAPSALIALKILGGLYLIYLAWGAGRSALDTTEGAPPPVVASFRAGLLLNLSNPKSVFAWTATIAVGTPVDAPELAWLLVPLAMGVTVAIYLVYGFAFSRGPMRLAYRRLRRWLDAGASALFGLAGLGLIRDGLLTLWRRNPAP